MPTTGSTCAETCGTSTGCHSGCLFIMSAPSGAGKTTLCNAMRRRFVDLAYSVSTTTRPARSGEQQGREYHFISRDEFEQGIADGRWAEWALVHGHYYGSSAQWIDRTLKSGADILMDIDVQGARQIVGRFPYAVTIFVMPPCFEELERRLRSRGTDDPGTVALRLANAREEIGQKSFYRYVVINDDLSQAVSELVRIFQRHRGHKNTDR